MKGDYFICKECGKLGWMEQWLIDEKTSIGSHLFCSHKCGKKYHHDHPEQHPHTKKMISQLTAGY